MKWNVLQAIIRKDLKVVIQNKGVSIPLFVGPILMLAGLAGFAALAPMFGNMFGTEGLDSLIKRLPGLQSALAGYEGIQKFIVLLLVYLDANFYLLLPLIVSTSIAADSFTGEKERKTLEALLYTPTTDMELLFGKLLSAWLPAVGVAWGGFILYSVMANLAAWPVMGRIFFPTTMWVILAVWVAPAAAGLGLGVMVLISSRARTFQAANQLGGMVALLVVGLLILQVFVGMVLSTWLVALLGLLFWIFDAVFLWFGKRSFYRSRLATEM